MKKSLIIIACLIPMLLCAGWKDLSNNSVNNPFDMVDGVKEDIRVDFALPGYESETVVEAGEEYLKISYPEVGELIEVGKPALPVFSTILAIADQGDVEIEILSVEEEIIEDVRIYPQQELQIESQPTNSEFVIDDDYYSKGGLYPLDNVVIGEPAIMRGVRVVNLSVQPFRYEAKSRKLYIVRDISLRVVTTGRGGANTLSQRSADRKASRSFQSFYKSTILNSDMLSTREEFQRPSYLVVHPPNVQVEGALNIWANWKREMGYEVVMVSTSHTGSNSSQLKNYIQNAYDTWDNPPEFILLAGNASTNATFHVPTHHIASGYGDHYYTMLEGNDILPDVNIGRFSYNNLTELQTIITKILNYEKEPYWDSTDWYEKALLVGDTSPSGQSCVDLNMHVRDMMLNHNPEFSFTELYSASPSSTQMRNVIDSGVSYFNYRGIEGMAGFTYEVNNLNNGLKLPVSVFLTCNTGNFAGTSDGVSEKMFKLGTPQNPRGAIAAIGTVTPHTHTMFNNVIAAGIFYGIFVDDIYHMGGALNRGKVNLYDNFGTTPAASSYVQNFSYWTNLMGDPGMKIWTALPKDFTIEYDDNVALGTNYLEVTVQSINDTPVEGAWVTALMGDEEIFASDYTDENGMVTLPIDAQDTGTVKLTVTKHNFKPHLGEFTISEQEQFVNIESYEIIDDNSGSTVGNGDGIVNPGETVDIIATMHNFGSMSVSGVTAELSSSDANVEIINSSVDYGMISSGDNSTPSSGFLVEFSPDILGGSIIEFDVQITDATGQDWEDKLFITVAGASLWAAGYEVFDGNNNILDPGETAELEVILENLGTVAAQGVNATLSTNNSNIEVDDDFGFFGTVPAGGSLQNSSNRFEVTASTYMLPGTQVMMNLHLYNNDGYDDNVSFLLEVGEVTVTDPLGPDDYGYWAYDCGDTDYYQVPEYDWIEIDPNYGGQGTILPVYDSGDMGDIHDIDLPITLRFYGDEYDMITVCTNGWIAPGGTDMRDYMSWQIPGPMGPYPLIAPFWDDLKMGGGNMVYYYDANNNYIVIQWSRMLNDFTNDEETFQAILYDANHYPTTLGDSEIKFQYKIINNTNSGSFGYTFQQGLYSTVGIANETATDGLQYTFNNGYPTAAKPLANEMAILFTGPPVSLDEPYIVLGGMIIDDPNGNGIAEYGEDINLYVQLNNIGESPATNVSATLSSTDEFITIDSNQSNYNNIAGGSSENNLTPFVISIAEDCPDGHNSPIQMQVQTAEETWDINLNLMLHAPEVEYVSTFVNDGDNNLLDPGETADILVSYENIGGAGVHGGVLELSTDDAYLTLNTDTYNIGMLPGNTIRTASFNVTADDSTPIGHVVMVDWELSADLNFEASGTFSIPISQVPLFLEEDFSGTWPPDGWQTTSTGGNINWQQNSSNNAGGEAPEARFYWSPSSDGTQRLISPPLSTLGHTSVDVEFKHYNNDFSGGYNIKVETTSNGGDTWNTVQTYPSSNFGPDTEELSISNDDVGSAEFQVAWTFDGDSWNINWYCVDDVVIGSGEGASMGFVVGTVTLSGGSGNVEEVEISADNYTTYPDSDGEYILPLPPGTYTMEASLSGYESVTVENVEVTETIATTVDFFLEETFVLQPPQNLTANLEDNNVHLTWDLPEIANRVTRSRMPMISDTQSSKVKEGRPQATLIGFTIYRNMQVIHEGEDPEQVSFVDENMNSGQYTYFLEANYDLGVSEPSNSVEVTVVLPIPENLNYSVSYGDVILDWDAPDTGIVLTSYHIYRDDMIIATTEEENYTDDTGVMGEVYTYYVTALYEGGYESGASNEVVVEVTSADDLIPAVTRLDNNYPNPFNPETTIRFSLHENNKVEIVIYNIKGEKVRELLSSELPASYHTVVWDGRNDRGRMVASGVYLYQMSTSDFSQIKKMLLMK
jgi:hypothetical protein